VPRLPSVLASLALLAALTAGGESSDDVSPAATPAASASAGSECREVPAEQEPGPDATTDLTTKPQPQIEEGPPPCDLVITDIVVGTGAEALTGAQADVRYVGALYDGGTEFDSSWSRSPQETLPVPLGQGGVIPGFEQGILGMREGGRRQVVIPGDLAYGPQGRPPIPPDATLVFVIDLVRVTPAP
jgi:peptidylprolyl isomerase